MRDGFAVLHQVRNDVLAEIAAATIWSAASRRSCSIRNRVLKT